MGVAAPLLEDDAEDTADDAVAEDNDEGGIEDDVIDRGEVVGAKEGAIVVVRARFNGRWVLGLN